MRKPFLFAFLLFSMIAVTRSAHAQPSAEGVRAVVDRLFDGMRSGDSTMVRSVMHPSARFMTTMVREGEPMLHTGSVDRFVEAVGTPHEEVWDEKIWNVDIKVDDNLAQVWMDYGFYLGDAFSHCGVNAMQLFHDGESWKIIQLADTRRTEGCEVPEGQ